MGMELGWNREMKQLATGSLEAQEERYRRTGEVTFVSEDAIPIAPHYFYYYAISYRGNPFSVACRGARPCWKGLAGSAPRPPSPWHALLPSPYTRLGADAVAPALSPLRGWSSGVFEAAARPPEARTSTRRR
jgi:hypothetical protein